VRYIVIPKGISAEIFHSQIIERFNGTEFKFLSYDKEQSLVTNLSDLSCVMDGDIIYFRSVTDFFRFSLGNIFFTKKVIKEFDFRGIISEESYLRFGSKTRRMLLRWLEYFSFKYADRLFAVSNNLANYLRKKYYSRDVTVIPCCVPSDFCVLKTTPSSHEEMRFIYLGSMSKWQAFSKVCELYSGINTELKTLTVITNDTVTANQMLNKYTIKAKVISGDKKIVLEQLDQADFGFIYRTNCKINTTASPVKFLEYTARGVIPVMSEYVGDYSETFKKYSYTIKNGEEKIDIKKLVKLRSDQATYRALFKLTNQYVWEEYF